MKIRNLLIIFLLLTSLFLFSCKDKTTNTVADTPTITGDAAQSIAGSLGWDTGGAVDQLDDLCRFSGINGLKISSKDPSDTYVLNDRVYDDNSGTWTLHFVRERGVAGSYPYAYMERLYLLQYRNSEGQPQQYYVTDADTAYTMHFQILEGNGTYLTRRIQHHLLNLTGDWTVTDANKSYVLINGTYNRSGIDSLHTVNRSRIMTHDIQLTFTNVRGPRGHWTDFSNKISGTVSGTYDGVVTVISGDLYSERSIHRDIAITFGEGKGNFSLDGVSHQANLASGELIN